MRGKESKGYYDRLRVKGFALRYSLFGVRGILEVRGKWSNEYSLNHIGTFPNSGACRSRASFEPFPKPSAYPLPP